MFFVFGLNGFLNFLPMPELGGAAGEFFAGLGAAGYFFPVLKAVETVCGALLLIRRFVPLALVLLAPIVVQIFLFHAFLDAAGLPMAIVLIALQAYLGFGVHGAAFKGVLDPRG